MKIIHFNSGLGNQIFQYMFYLYIKNQTKENVYGYYNKKWLQQHNGLEIHKVFDIILPKHNKISDIVAFLCRTINKIIPQNRIYSTDKNLNLKSIYFTGYWQDKKFFKDLDFNLTFRVNVLNEKNRDIVKVIKGTNSVSIHIRRGDYLKEASKYGNICTLEYYNKAIEIIRRKVEEPTFFIFSDDIDWARKNFHLEKVFFVDWNCGTDSYLDMYLMSLCQSHIIANSSFSFWGAYLSKINKITICPKKWYNDEVSPDIAPDEWIKI